MAAEIVIGAAYALGGAGYVLDDWFTLGNAKVDGVWGTPGHLIFVNRPGAGLLYCLVFGVFGGHPLVGLALLTALGAATAAVLYVLCRRFVSVPVAAAVATVWVVLPNHTSLEFWQSCTSLAAATLLTVVAALFVARRAPSTRQTLIAAALVTAGSLTYEAVFPVGALVVVFLPLLAGRAWRGRDLIGRASLLLPAAVYLVLYRSTQKTISKVGPLGQVLAGHFGWGIVPGGTGATVVLLVAMLALAVAGVRLALPGFRTGTGLGERLVVIGLVVIAAGTIPFTFYLYAPLGAGDRFDLVSSIGGALAWTGIGLMLWRWRTVVAAGAAVLLVMAFTARVQRMERWTTAAADSNRVARAITARFPQPPPQRVVLGPSPVQDHDVAALLDQSNVAGLLRFLYGRTVPGGIAYRRADYDRTPAAYRFDVWRLSHLRADVDLSSDRQGVPVTAQ
ncbi:MAG TPA: hypothetical protein VHC63_07145 [Acidimicrobiales bacterium]|nr:hypothetical protein [Acidimicrobiales bacterium]